MTTRHLQLIRPDRPQPLNHRCPYCGAAVGKPCDSPIARKRQRGHAARQDAAIRAFNRAHVAWANQHDDDLPNGAA